MSPLSLRRYRAERLLREEFARLRARVLANVRARLRFSGVCPDASDLDACYAQAWQGLYAAVLGGERIANPGGWLSVVTTRRAIDEHRARERAQCRAVGAARAVESGEGAVSVSGEVAMPVSSHARLEHERDLAAELDDRARLRQLFEALRGRLSSRELQAAALCYLQGLPRSEAAAQMGLSQRRMRKLMDGTSERPGVAGKVGALADTIRAGGWCDEQGSLMRAFAYGILDPLGERHQLALIHSSECPACRAYVLSLRGLAAALPPVPMLLRWALAPCAGGGAGAGLGAHAAASGGSPVAAGAAGSGLAPTAPVLAGALSASGAGASAAGGGWLLAGAPLGAKLAAGCALALGLGAGCVVLAEHHPAPARAPMREAARDAGGARGARGARAPGAPALATWGGRAAARAPTGPAAVASGGPSAPGRASGSGPAGHRPRGNAVREFGPERQLQDGGPARGSPPGGGAGQARAVARTASAPEGQVASGNAPAEASSPAPRSGSSAPAPAEREFAPG